MGRKERRVGPFSIDQSIPYLMNRITNLLNQRLHDLLLVHGLTFQHWRVLAALASQKNPTISQIASYAVVPHSTLSRLLSRMERQKLIERGSSKKDGRVARIQITTHGRKVLKRVIPYAVRVRQEALVGFRPESVRRLHGALVKMHAAIANAKAKSPIAKPHRGRDQ